MAFQSPWQDIGDQLDSKYSDKLFYHQRFKDDNFLKILVPLEEDIDKFFGTKVKNLFIAQRAYGWVPCVPPDEQQLEFRWPPDGFDELRELYLQYRDRFASYETLIWVDFWSAQMQTDIIPTTEWLEMMEQTDEAIQEFCDTTPGFTYMGRITEQVEPNFFYQYIEE